VNPKSGETPTHHHKMGSSGWSDRKPTDQWGESSPSPFTNEENSTVPPPPSSCHNKSLE
jgi:hypothetical protein